MQRYWNRLAWLHNQPLEGYGLQRGRLNDDREVVVWLAGQGGFIAGQVAEILEHGAQPEGGQAGFRGLVGELYTIVPRPHRIHFTDHRGWHPKRLSPCSRASPRRPDGAGRILVRVLRVAAGHALEFAL